MVILNSESWFYSFQGKLDVYKKKVSDGQTLDPDQKAAADKYDEVIGSLDFAKEMQKMLEVTMAEVCY